MLLAETLPALPAGAASTVRLLLCSYRSTPPQPARTQRLGTDKIDFSYLQPTSGQPKIIQGQMNGAYAVAVITQHP